MSSKKNKISLEFMAEHAALMLKQQADPERERRSDIFASVFYKKYKKMLHSIPDTWSDAVKKISSIMLDILPYVFCGPYETRYFASMDFDDFFDKCLQEKFAEVSEFPGIEYIDICINEKKFSKKELELKIKKNLLKLQDPDSCCVKDIWASMLYLNEAVFLLFSDELDEREAEGMPQIDLRKRKDWIPKIKAVYP